jgi:hypothetical protein
LNENKVGESSKLYENIEQAKSLEEQRYNSIHEEYRETKKVRLGKIREYNDIMDKIEKDGDTMGAAQKESLLNEAIKHRSAVDLYSKHAQNLKDALNIPSSEEEYSSGDNSSGYSSDEGSRPSSNEDSRPSKRPRE